MSENAIKKAFEMIIETEGIQRGSATIFELCRRVVLDKFGPNSNELLQWDKMYVARRMNKEDSV